MARDIEDVEGLSADARRLYDWMIATFTGDVNEALDIAKSHATSISKWTRERLREAHAELKERGVLEATAPALREAGPSERHHAKQKASRSKTTRIAPLGPPRSKVATVLVYSRPSGYWYAQAHDATTGAQITDASGYSRENVLRELRGKFAMTGVTIKSITDEDPYVAGHSSQRYHATKKSSAQLEREINEALSHTGRRAHSTKKPHVTSPEGRLADLQRQGFMKRGPMQTWIVAVEAPSGDPSEATYIEVQGKTKAAALRAAQARKPGARLTVRYAK